MKHLKEVTRILQTCELPVEVKMLCIDFFARAKSEEAKEDFARLLIEWDKSDNTLEAMFQERLSEIEKAYEEHKHTQEDATAEVMERIEEEVADAEKIASVKASIS